MRTDRFDPSIAAAPTACDPNFCTIAGAIIVAAAFTAGEIAPFDTYEPTLSSTVSY